MSEDKLQIIIDGTPHEWKKEKMSYEEVIDLAYDGNPPEGENIEITVAYQRGHGDKHEGDLAPGEKVKVKDGMIFDVTATDRS
jgi:Multiubiquitin